MNRIDSYAARRARVLEMLGDDAALVLAAAPELNAGSDAELRYVVDPELYYLTGYIEPEAVLVLGPKSAEAPFALFVRERDADRELWTGARGGTEAAVVIHNSDAAWPIGDLAAGLRQRLRAADTVYARLGTGRPEVDAAVLGAIASGRRLRPRTGRGLHTVSDPGIILDDMRLIKDDGEIALMREAARISVESFREAAMSIRPGTGEWQVEAALEGGFRMRGGSGPAFPSIVAAGANATVLHYVANSCTMNAGDLLLIDAGARRRMYCADISRTFAVSGAFTDAQRDLYDTVLAARDAAIAAVRPGATVDEVHDAALAVLVEGLIELGFVAGTTSDAKRNEDAWKPFFPHRTSHWLGLDVHDVGMFVANGRSRPLEPGMVLTIEPGLYIPAATGSGPGELHGTGVRIEDDVLVTAGGGEVLTAELPADRESLTAMMSA